MASTEPVRDWAEDYDIFDPGYIRDPYPVWDDLRQRCPVARTERWGGSWMPVTYELVSAMAHDTEHFSSEQVLVVPPEEDPAFDAEHPELAEVAAPPITSDPPEHAWARRLILPSFSPKAVAGYEPLTRDLCRRLVEPLVAAGQGDAAADYGQQIPVRVIATMLGIPDTMADTFTGWVRGALEIGATDPEVRRDSFLAIGQYFVEQVGERRLHPGHDLISELLAADVDGEPVPEHHVIGTCLLILIAGIDTTWSAIGSSLWHLATHPDDRRRLVADPGLMPTAVEELLRAYSPVTMARIVKEEVEVEGRRMCPADRVLLNFPAANRDPAAFTAPEVVDLARERNRHIAFGAGIHRCAGSHLARMELRVALEEWLRAAPDFSLDDPDRVTWAGGQVRGPRTLPVAFG